MLFYRLLQHLLPLSLLTACAAISPPPLDYHSGALVETLSSSVSLSISASDRSMGGNGYLVFRRPDQLHLVVLSPFGTTVMEAFALGERIALVYPSQGMAYIGRFDELPDKGGFKEWRLIRWLMDADPRDSDRLSGTVERMSKLGFTEKITFQNGLVISKVSSSGDQIYYGKYAVINSVPLASELDMRNKSDDRIRIMLEEPEVNTPLDDAAFMPRLEGLTIMPLSAIQGL